MNRTVRILLFVQAAVIAFAVAALALRGDIGPTATHGQTGLLWSLNADPTAGGGVAAPLWQLLVRTDVPSIYYKSGAGNTAWTLLGTSAAGAGTVTSVTCGTNLACAPNPIVNAGTVATVAAPTFAGTVTGGAFATAGNVNAPTGIVTGGQLVATGVMFAQSGLFGDVTHDGLFTFELGGLSGPTERPFSGDPNGTGAVDGSIALDTTGKVWVKHGAAGVWKQLAEAGAGAAPMFPNVHTAADNTAAFGTVNDMNLGAFALAPTYVQLTQQHAAITITGIDASTAVDGTVIYVQEYGTLACATAAIFSNEDAGSLAANRILTAGAASRSMTCQGGAMLRYDGGASRWMLMQNQ